MGLYLGIDIGTSGARALIIDESGSVKGSGSSEYPLSTPRPLWAEQDPEDWWQGVKQAFAIACNNAGVSASDVSAIGLSGQMHGAVVLDGNDRVIRPSILWCDQRTAAECAEITERAGESVVKEITLNPVLTGFQAPKVVWLKNNEPDNYARIKRLLLPKDYIRFRLSGAYATEVSDASGTSLLNIRKRSWSLEMLEAAMVEESWLPECFESVEASTEVSAKAASELGLKAGAPIVGGGGDQAAGGVGTGIVEEGLVSSSLGTSGVVFAHADEPFVDEKLRTHTFCHAVPGKWHTMGCVISAGGSLRWYRDTFCSEEKTASASSGRDAYDLMTETASAIPEGSEGLYFLPYLSGERTPYPDPNARGVFFGATLSHTKAHFTRAVLEGVGYGLLDSFSLMQKMGIKADQVRVFGGGAKSPMWTQLLTNLIGLRHVTLNVDEGPAFGVALLAAVSQGVWPTIQDACRATLKPAKSYEPDSEATARYHKRHLFYQSLYPALKDRYQQLADLESSLS